MNRLFLMASLILVGCAVVPDHERVAFEANPTDQYGDCGIGGLYTCEDFRMVRGLALVRGHDDKMTRGYRAILEKVGKDIERLEAEYGEVERGLMVLGCEDQAPGVFAAVLRPGDEVRDYWCSRKFAERFEAVRADKRN